MDYYRARKFYERFKYLNLIGQHVFTKINEYNVMFINIIQFFKKIILKKIYNFQKKIILKKFLYNSKKFFI